MAIFKCKMCGGSLEVSEGMTVCECEYCGTQQTLPSFDNEKKINLFNRANQLRFKCDFDGAEGIYQSIVSEFPMEAEAYWGLCLCKYGIEYVEDPLTGNKIPTCHRTSFDSILNDPDYLSALKNADGVAKSVYEAEAKAIDTLQQKILSVVKNEKPYDVFICYKESDAEKNRTPDSVLAQDIYDSLTAKGMKVFFSRITLEDKLGADYEPYIFAALQSAKVMLVVATSIEYVEATWVKNEWSRFARLAASDKSKVLIPCYSGIDPADLPTALATRQAQDMDKLGAMQDLVRGIEKLTGHSKQEQSANQTSSEQSSNPQKEATLKRVVLFLEEGDFESAKEYCNRVLDVEPECAQAYFYMMMADIQTTDENDLLYFGEIIAENKYYKLALRFADYALKEKLENIVSDYNAKTEEANTIISKYYEQLSGETLEVKLKKAEKALENLNERLSQINASLPQMELRVDEGENAELQRKANIVDTELSDLKQTQKQIKEQIDKLTAEHRSLGFFKKAQKEQLLKEIEILRQQKNGIDKSVAEKESELNEINNQIRKNNSLTSEISQLRSEKQRIEETLIPEQQRIIAELNLDISNSSVITKQQYDEAVSFLEEVTKRSNAAKKEPANSETEDPSNSSQMCELILVSFGDSKMGVIKAVKELSGLGLKESKELVERVPTRFCEGLYDELTGIKEELERAGAQTDIRPM